MPIVSAVIPTFGRPDLVCRAVRSVLSQTLAEVEVIVVIDGDDPQTIAQLGEIQDARLKWIVHAEKRGAGQTRDTGAQAAASPWVAFLDDDDEWLPEKLERQLASAGDPPAVIMTLTNVVSSYGSFVRPGEIYANDMPVDEWLFDRRVWTKGGESFLQTSSLVFPRALFDVTGFRDTKQHEEWELVIRAVKEHGYPLVTTPEPLVIYYVPEQRQSLSRTYTWRRSIDWACGLGPLLTKRAFSGFCLTVVAQMAATVGDRKAILPLLHASYKFGSPTAKQLFAFAFFWLCPPSLRFRLRALLQGRRTAS